MAQIFLTTFPFFALILCGYLATRSKLLPIESIPALNAFVLYFALPCMLFRFGANTPVTKLLDAAAFVTYFVAAVMLVAITVATTRSKKTGWNDASFGALVAAFPNTGFMGMPLLISLAGPSVASPVIVSLSIDIIVTSSLCIALSRLTSGGPQGSVHAARNALKSALMNPLPWAILLGVVASWMSLQLSTPFMHVVEMLADTGSPTGLFTIGTVLARSHMMKESAPPKVLPAMDETMIVFYKLILHPALVFGIGSLLIRFGIPLDPFVLTILILVAALPSASNVPILAERYHANAARIAHIVLISTTLSFLSFSTAVAIFLR